MKKLFTVLLLASTTLVACKKDCDVRNPACKDVTPTNEMCNAYFQRWFYNAQTNQCQLIGYSGCSQKGFATQADCQSCVKVRN